jgi:membrane protease YdiL (CAAX protease family)
LATAEVDPVTERIAKAGVAQLGTYPALSISRYSMPAPTTVDTGKTPSTQTSWWLVTILAAIMLPLFLAPWIAPILGWRLDSVITRSMMIFGSGALLWHFGFPTRAWIQTVVGARPWRNLASGLAITIACCCAYSVTLIALDAEDLRPVIFRPDRLITGLLTGLVVSLIEEPVFRWVLLRKLAFHNRFAVGAVLASSIYALIHYVRPSKIALQVSYDLSDSLKVYSDMLTNLVGPFQDPMPFLGLFLLGLLLCSVAHRAGIAWTIGIHAGLVYYVKADSCLLYWNHVERHWLFGSQNIKYDGVMFWVTCGLFLLVLALRQRPSAKARDSSPQQGVAGR